MGSCKTCGHYLTQHHYDTCVACKKCGHNEHDCTDGTEFEMCRCKKFL